MEEVIAAIAVVHAELVLIHPFREGNGRLARILAILMALQAGLPPLDFGAVKGKKRQEYFAAVKAGLDRNYEPMKKVFSGVVRRTLRLHARQ
jgi:cell filamentation protein